MADDIRRVEHYSISIPDKVGEGARILGALRDNGVNFIAVWGYPRGAGKARLELIPENASAFEAATKQAKLRPKKSTAFHITGEDHPGAIADVLKKLAEAKINVGAAQAICAGAGRYGAVLFLSPSGTKKAATVLGAA